MKIIKKIWHLIYFAFDILLYFLSFPLAFLLYGKKKCWLISEIDFDARDNGYHLFKYINENHPEINSIYLISKKIHIILKFMKLGKLLNHILISICFYLLLQKQKFPLLFLAVLLPGALLI